jgi:DNA integrity scanning protein DisA with diadenylate cyclase activity/mannitol/fructose-specific phosphotransferase system IIA component (Ntr-type)
VSLDIRLARRRLINVKGFSLEEALRELLAILPHSLKIDRDQLLYRLLEREKSISTYLGNGVIMPYLRIAMARPYLLAIGRCPKGLTANGQTDYGNVRLIFLLLFNETDGHYLQTLDSLARVFHDPQKIAAMVQQQPLDRFHRRFLKFFGKIGPPAETLPQQRKDLHSFLKESSRLAAVTGCNSVFFFADAIEDWCPLQIHFPKMKRFLVTERPLSQLASIPFADHILHISNYDGHRLAQVNSAILLALSQNLLHMEEKVCCLGGCKGSNCLDCLMVVNVAEEYKTLLQVRKGLIPRDVLPEVFERVIAIAHEISCEGREGHSVGVMFVVGNHDRLKNHYRPLILNPFHGYPRHERNLLNPFMGETIKEFASLDGAFIIDGDGVLEAAGTMIHSKEYAVELQGGLGTRHSSAAAFSKSHDCLIIVVSQSSSQVTLFCNGQIFPLARKMVG